MFEDCRTLHRKLLKVNRQCPPVKHTRTSFDIHDNTRSQSMALSLHFDPIFNDIKQDTRGSREIYHSLPTADIMSPKIQRTATGIMKNHTASDHIADYKRTIGCMKYANSAGGGSRPAPPQ